MTDERKQQIKRDIQARYHWSIEDDAVDDVRQPGKTPDQVLSLINAHGQSVHDRIPDLFDLTPEEGSSKPVQSWTRPVICITNGKRFNRVGDAAKWACVSPSGIVKSCTRGNYVDGLRFMYADSPEPPPVVKYMGSGRISKRVECCTDTGKVVQFDNVRDAAERFGLLRKDIWNAIRKGQRSGGVRWKWVDAA